MDMTYEEYQKEVEGRADKVKEEMGIDSIRGKNIPKLIEWGMKNSYLVSDILDFGFSEEDISELAKLHRDGDDKVRSYIEDLLEDCNFHRECSDFSEQKYAPYIVEEREFEYFTLKNINYELPYPVKDTLSERQLNLYNGSYSDRMALFKEIGLPTQKTIGLPADRTAKWEDKWEKNYVMERLLGEKWFEKVVYAQYDKTPATTKEINACIIEEKLQKGLSDMLDSDKYKEYLTTASKFTHYSLNNTILIYVQDKEASRVATANQWKDLGRYINKGEHSNITLFRPVITKCEMKEDETIDEAIQRYAERYKYYDACDINSMRKAFEEGKPYEFLSGYSTFKVFDIRQTNGKDIITAHDLCKMDIEGNIEHFDEIRTSLEEIAKKNGIENIFYLNPKEDSTLENGAYGYCNYSSKKIVIRDDISDANKISVLAHELGHAIMHSKEAVENGEYTSVKERGVKELQAESVAFMICQNIGFDIGENSFGYIATWGKGQDETLETFKKSMDAILKCTTKIMDSGLSDTLDKIRENEEKEVMTRLTETLDGEKATNINRER